MSEELQRQVAGLTALLLLEREAREAATPLALAFVMANRTRTVLPCDTAAVWSGGPGAVRLEAVSDVSSLDPASPHVVDLTRVVGELAASGTGIRREEGVWAEAPAHALACPLPTGEGGFILFRAQPWRDGEVIIAERLAGAFGHCRKTFAPSRRPLDWRRHRRWWPAAAVAAAALLFLPVRQSAVAPATVVARTPLVAAAPVDGLVAEIAVQPNQAVKAGEVLFRLDATQARNQLQAAINAEKVAEADYLKTQQQAFFDLGSKTRLAAAKAQMELHKDRVGHAGQLLERTVVRAERDGVVLFSAPEDWIGRPVSVGQRIMTLADPAQVRVEVALPADDAMALPQAAEVELFLNIDPLTPVKAVLAHAAYEAEPAPEGFLAYRLTAELAPGEAPPRIGLRGTAKVYGERVPLFRVLFRRPLAALRRTLRL